MGKKGLTGGTRVEGKWKKYLSLVKCLCFFFSRSPGLLEKANSGSNLAAINRYVWIRVALFEKRLQKIVAFLVEEADK